jgi:inhibitor of cysteine peptidase
MKENKKRLVLSIWLIVITTLFFLTFAYCNEEGTQKESSKTDKEVVSKENTKEEDPPSVNPDIITLTGTIVFKDIEGGFYGIIGDDGKNYEPSNLSDEFKKDGLKVKFTARLHTDWASISMFGTIIELLDIESIEK